MPEGHTLHRLARELNEVFAGRHLEVSSPQGRFADGAALVNGGRLIAAEAAGKHLLLTFGVGRRRHIVHIHLGLYGTFVVTRLKRGHEATPPVGLVRLRLVGKKAFADLRGATVCELLVPAEVAALRARLGPDPLDPDADGSRAFARIHRSAAPIATLLMNQAVLAGVGNVYRAELLFRHEVDPYLKGQLLPEDVWIGMWRDLVELMDEGVQSGSIDTVADQHLPEATGRDARVDRHGGEVYVYRRAGMPCLVCGTEVRTAVLEGRNLFWCPRCQPRGSRGTALAPVLLSNGSVNDRE